ncbi:DUF998 domain-containing protein [Luteimonas sp. S4-F44]|uniref:DUF998 domain-containing protein n=1 Tax=Luteimonas sp. S4-F44 TaxID=2925842 RepID=UPI001F52B6B5|nr:DUF998 domain-containing protein [Luteimonas sp. S4-F44]UNK43505.1 DUF998 domain-containing protein [Luteimonas sp. S4-F44]
MGTSMRWWALGLVLVAHAVIWLAMFGFARVVGLPAGVPLALPGAHGLPHAGAFNLLAFVLPGFALAIVAWRARARWWPDAGLAVGIALRLWLLAALLFALQGGLPLDAGDLDGGGSRAHASVWMLWALAFGAGASLAAIAVPGVRLASLLAALAVVAALALPAVAAAGAADRVLLLAWCGWTAWLAWRLPRRAG